MKKSAVIRIVVYSLIILVLTAVLAAGILLPRWWNRFGAHTGLSGAASGGAAVEQESVRELEIQWTAGSVTIQPDDIDRIEFSETGGEEHPMVWKQTMERLVIRYQEGGAWSGWETHSKDLVIRVPRQWQPEEVEIQTTSARVAVSDLTAGALELNVVSGRTEVAGCTARELSFEGVSGAGKLAGQFGSLDVSTVSGECTLTLGEMSREVELESVSGDMMLVIPEDSGFTAQWDSVSGDLHSELEIRSSGGQYIRGDGAAKIDAESVSGDLTIRPAK